MSTGSRILKAGTTQTGQGPVVFNYDDLQTQGEAYLQKVREQAAGLIAEARQQAAKIVQEARAEAAERGYREGETRARNDVQQLTQAAVEAEVTQKVSSIIPAIEQAAGQIQQLKSDWVAKWESLAVELALAISERLLRQKLELDPANITPMVRGALELASREQLTLAIHPLDWAALGEQEGLRVLAAMAGCGEVTVRENSSLSRGSCVVSTLHGEIDARLETMLDRMASELLGTADRRFKTLPASAHVAGEPA